MQRDLRVSKILSLALRHKPEVLNLEVDVNGGWAQTEQVLQSLRTKGLLYVLEELEKIVAVNDKKRFEFNADKTKIRAVQGHSIKVELDYEQQIPPEILYHGTCETNAQLIRNSGAIKPGSRLFTHLSADLQTAIKVGTRHGQPEVLQVLAKQMHDDGYCFYLTTNNVWLIEQVPVKYIK